MSNDEMSNDESFIECPRCKRKIFSDSNYCKYCGRDVSKIKEIYAQYTNADNQPNQARILAKEQLMLEYEQQEIAEHSVNRLQTENRKQLLRYRRRYLVIATVIFAVFIMLVSYLTYKEYLDLAQRMVQLLICAVFLASLSISALLYYIVHAHRRQRAYDKYVQLRFDMEQLFIAYPEMYAIFFENKNPNPRSMEAAQARGLAGKLRDMIEYSETLEKDLGKKVSNTFFVYKSIIASSSIYRQAENEYLQIGERHGHTQQLSS